jgi:hypothetical protein
LASFAAEFEADGTASRFSGWDRDTICSGRAWVETLKAGVVSKSPFPYPVASSLRRAQQWQEPPYSGPSLDRVAYHEAGHIVLFEWIGLDDIKATASPTSGRAYFPEIFPPMKDTPPDKTGELAATAAAVFHAGIMAELLHCGHGWQGPIHYARQIDYQAADDMLAPSFGRHASGGHSFAQRVALHVLSGRWQRVQEVAEHLIKNGRWKSGDSQTPTQLQKL